MTLHRPISMNPQHRTQGSHDDRQVGAGHAQSPSACCAPIGASRLTDSEARATAALFKTLGDPNRVRIINLLASAGEPVCVCDLTEPLGIAQPTVSHHLKKLVSAGLLTREQRGTWAYYALDEEAMRRLAAVANIQGGRT